MAEKSKLHEQKGETDLLPDAWERFERFIKKAAKMAPQHRRAKERAASKGRVCKGKSRN